MSPADRVDLMADLMMGAAHADSELREREVEAVRDLLCKLTGTSALSDELQTRLARFRPAEFSLSVAASAFASESPARKRQLLELIAAVQEADQEIDLAEDGYLKSVAEALGVKREDYADLALEVEISDLADGFRQLRHGTDDAR